MNLKKYLKQRAEEDAESLITESDREFCMQLAQNARQIAPKRKRFNLAAVSSAAAVCLVAVILGITLPLVLNRQPAVEEIHYKEENVAKTACTIEEVNINTKYFQISQTENIIILPMLNYDSVSGDKLYYSVSVTTQISVFTLYIVINENYSYSFEKYEDLSYGQLAQYSVEYNVERVDGVMATELKYRGIISVESETVYIDYTQNFDIGDDAFLDDIQNVLKVKN